MTQDKFSVCLWFDYDQGEPAVALYTSIFKDSRIVRRSTYPADAPGPAGKTMTIEFELEGRRFTALCGGPAFKLNEAASIEVRVDTQAEVDALTEQLTAGGGEQGPCGWVKDRFGLSWQVVPRVLLDVVTGPDAAKTQRVMSAMLKMHKLDIAALLRAAEG